MDLKNKLDVLKKILFSSELPTHAFLEDILEKTCGLLEKESSIYRPLTKTNQAGSLLDFTNDKMPTIVVPDLHARPFFVWNILNYNLPQDFLSGDGSLKVIDALEQKKIRIICVGDALHTEKVTKDRWIAALVEYYEHIYTGPSMSAEMIEGLNLILGLMQLKINFTEHFHFLKGNHENILNRTGKGDYAFKKYADEGQMVKQFITEYYGEDILYRMSYVEDALPLIAVTCNAVISHAEPKKCYTREQFINAREYNNGEIVDALTWTDNGSAQRGSVLKIINNLANKSSEKELKDYSYFGGHRPVLGDYALRQNNRFVQIHNPTKQNIVLLYPERKFLPQMDIVSVEKL